MQKQKNNKQQKAEDKTNEGKQKDICMRNIIYEKSMATDIFVSYVEVMLCRCFLSMLAVIICDILFLLRVSICTRYSTDFISTWCRKMIIVS